MPKKPVPGETVVIHLAGDAAPRRIDYGESPESIYAMVRGKVKKADISFCHLERSLSTKGCLQYRARPTWYGRHHPDNVKSLVYGGFNVASHASNNCFDYGPEALQETLEVLRHNNIRAVGAGKDIAEARKPVIIENKGVKIGFLAYCSVMDVEYEAREDKPGCNPIRVSTYYEVDEPQPGNLPRVITVPLEQDVRAMEEDIHKLRDQVDVLIVSQHWGLHRQGVLAMYQPTVGHRAIDAGADFVAGHHSSFVQQIEVYKGKAIFYSLGNFGLETPHHLKPPPGVVFNKASTQVEPGWERYPGPRERRYTTMAKCIAGKNGIQRVSFFPGWINQRTEPELLSRSDPRFQEVLDYSQRLCDGTGTRLTVEADEVIVDTSTGK
ncbi:MAG: CapA family protein [Chloroflexi bacterium]|nr:CapA family protein [Chloroflexota bacterium]